jgi:beta-galactosidase
MCEFSHAMGNSNGTLAEYWDAIESTPGLQGGFIWEFWDHGLVQTLPDGRTRWAYGGDFGEQPHDGNFVCDGMVWPDRRPKPAMWEHKRLAAPVRISGSPEDLVAGRVELANHQHFSDLGWLRASYSLTVGGDEVAAGAFGLPDLGPGERATVALPGWVAPSTDQGEAFLTVGITTAADLPWAPAGFEVCALQLPVREATAAPATATAPDPAGSVPLDTDGRLVNPLLAAAPTLSLWRAPTDNDRIGGMAARWAELGVDRLERRLVGIDRMGSSTVVRSEFVTGDGTVVPHEAAYTCLADGGIAVEETVTLPEDLADLARVGTVLEVVSDPEDLRWFGSGPHETYPDRKRGGLAGIWRSTVTDQYVPYIRPQENGGHADVRWLELTDAGGAGLRIELDQPRQVSVSHLRAADLAVATHDIDVVPVAEAVIHLDAAHRGLGTASCGPDTLPEYRLGSGIYRWAWTLRDLRPS